ncbi:MerR family transcriptional regulator [Saccharibacillus sp. CPCC 101409]|uniref:MerR family transcriptional regulator n=1 Tax=Saccharibacillus sp. CPCC 101409 TaxID=3058041 RepID=UPI002673128B|nr:MerR family transcriptional regulator [Saccharibacillus sp. CPCC 101409]MDO3413353.1 MerR family transcriptional regulator [Saccharibacillus sp. CPCC 101409]
MKTYTIGEAARELNLTPYTLRYYDKEGLMPFVERTSGGTRFFKESDLEALRIIECLKSTSMPIKEIKTFIDWCSDGDATLQQRFDMFRERKATVETQMRELLKTMQVIEHKCEYYRIALAAGTEKVHRHKQTRRRCRTDQHESPNAQQKRISPGEPELILL